MGAPIPESEFLMHQDLLKQEVREIVNAATTEMQQTRCIIQDLKSTVEEFKTQLTMMAAIKPLLQLLWNQGLTQAARPAP